MTSETIVAVSTPAGHGGVGVLRVSGPQAGAILRALTGLNFQPGSARYATFRDAAGAVIDHGVVVVFGGPRSYTGEDVVELQAHGNPLLLNALLLAACDAGARPARPGEFTERAYRNNKLSLEQAEAVADLIAGQSARAVRAARRTLEGVFGAAVTQLVSDIQQARAELEASIDFMDDVPADHLIDAQSGKLATLLETLDDIVERAARGRRLASGAVVAIIGAPNVGKSSLLNALAGHDRVIVSPQAGTTRDSIEVALEINGLALRLVDTAGLHASEDALEVAGMARSRAAIDAADLLLLVTDCETPQAAADLLDTLSIDKNSSTPTLVVHNKSDLYAAADGAVDPLEWLSVSARTGTGLDNLRAAIGTALGVGDGGDNEFAARERHLVALQNARDALLEINAAQLKQWPELAGEHYRAATDALGHITGRYATEDLLGDIFAQFCIGK